MMLKAHESTGAESLLCAATHETKPYLPAPAPLILHSKGQERGCGKDRDTALPGCHHSALTQALQEPPLFTPWHCCCPQTQPCSSKVGQVTKVHPHLLSIPKTWTCSLVLQQCCIHSGQACSHSDVFPQLFRLQSCLKDFSCFWNRGKKKKTLTHVYTWGAGREITQGKWSGWW